MYFRKRVLRFSGLLCLHGPALVVFVDIHSVWLLDVIASMVACVGQIRIIITVKTLSGSPLAFQLVS